MSSSSFYSTNSAAPHHEGVVHYEFDLGLIGMDSSPVTLLQAMQASNSAPVRPKRRTQTRPTAEFDRNSSGVRIKCPDCTRTFSSNDNLRRHRLTHSENPKPFGCNFCGKRFTQSYNRTLHKRRDHPEEYEQEEKAQGQGDGAKLNMQALAANCRVKSRPRKPEPAPDLPTPVQDSSTGRFKCHICPRTFAEIGFARRHQMRHTHTVFGKTAWSPFVCNFCGKGLATAAVLVYHKQRYHQVEFWAEYNRIRPGARGFQCPKCPDKFIASRFLKLHIRSLHGEKTPRPPPKREARKSSKELSCEFCPMTFRLDKEQHYFREHMRFHSEAAQAKESGGAAQRACPWPRYRITPKVQDIFDRIGRRGGKVGQIRIKYMKLFDPTIDLPRCPECGQCSLNKYNLLQHKRRAHLPSSASGGGGSNRDADDGGANGKLHACLYCPHQCKGEETLQRHVRAVHEATRRYESKYCSRVFTCRESARIHSRVHERRGICGQRKGKGMKSFSCRLQGRLRSRTCELCGEECQNEFFFAQHILKKHGGGDKGGNACKVKLQRLKIKPVDVDYSEMDECVLCTVCGNWFKRSEFKIHLALTQATCGSVQEYRPLSPEAPSPDCPDQMEDLEAEDTAAVEGKEEFYPADKEAEPVPEFDDGFGFDHDFDDCDASTHEEAPEPQPTPNSNSSPIVEVKEEGNSEPESESEVKAEADEGMDIDKHLRHRRVFVSLSRMQFRHVEEARFMSVLRPSTDSFHIPWYVCGKCGRAFAFRVEWQEHRVSCPRQYEFAHRNMIQDRVRRAELDQTAQEQKAKDKARGFPAGWTDRWDTDLLPETLPHPSTHSGVVMLGNTAFCRVCFKNFVWCRGIQGHMEQHDDEAAADADPNVIDPSSRWKRLEDGRIQCTVCEKAFGPRPAKISYAKLNHFRVYHTDVCQKASYTCELCGKRLGSESTLAAHVRSQHTGEKPYECDQCPTRFASSAALSQHKRDTHNTRPIQCAECGKMCKNYSDHAMHKRWHRLQAAPAELRETRCAECGKEFKHWRRRLRHAADVHGAGPSSATTAKETGLRHACDKCPKIFPHASSLKRHLITEHPANGVKPKFFQCKLCEQGFSLVASMRSHLRSAHAAELWPPDLLQQNKVRVPATTEGDSQTQTPETTYSLENYFIRKKWSQFM